MAVWLAERIAIDYGLGAALRRPDFIGRMVGFALAGRTALGLAAESLAVPWRSRTSDSSVAGVATVRPPSRGERAGSSMPTFDVVVLGSSTGHRPFVVVMILGSMLPSIDFDVLEYHLQGPKEYYQAGRIAFLPHNVYTSMPFGVEMLHLTGDGGAGRLVVGRAGGSALWSRSLRRRPRS